MSTLAELLPEGTTYASAVWERLVGVTYLPGEHGNWTEDTEGAKFANLIIGESVPEFAGPLDSTETDLGTLPQAQGSQQWLFVGWLGSDGNTYSAWDAPASLTLPTSGMTFTALWTAYYQTLTFSANGGTLTGDSSVTLPATSRLSRAGYEFAGWARTSDAASALYDTSVATIAMPTEATTLYAVWKQTVVELSFAVQKESITGVEGSWAYGRIDGPSGAAGLFWTTETVHDPRSAYVLSFSDISVNAVGKQYVSAVMGEVYDSDMTTVRNNLPYEITATAFTGYEFVKWIDEDGNTVSTNATLKLAASDVDSLFHAHSYYAVFAELPAIPYTQLNEIMNGKRSVSPDFALMVEAALDINPMLLINMQNRYNMAIAMQKPSLLERMNKIRRACAAIRSECSWPSRSVIADVAKASSAEGST